jgi:hypothetical protein
MLPFIVLIGLMLKEEPWKTVDFYFTEFYFKKVLPVFDVF